MGISTRDDKATFIIICMCAKVLEISEYDSLLVINHCHIGERTKRDPAQFGRWLNGYYTRVLLGKLCAKGKERNRAGPCYLRRVGYEAVLWLACSCLTIIKEVVPKPEALQSRPWGWDKGIFASELIRQGILPRSIESKIHSPLKNSLPTPPPLANGTYRGTRTAATELYNRIEDRFGAFFDVANFESSIPQAFSLDSKKNLYTFQEPGSDKYSPHLAIIPAADQVGLLGIFNAMRLADTATLFTRIIPDFILKQLHDNPMANTISGMEARNKTLRSEGKDIFAQPNIGDRSDWYSDAVFAQQQFTGPNPATITTASAGWVQKFQQAASAQGNTAMIQLLGTASTDGSLYIQDCSYFRKVAGAPPGATLQSDDKTRFGCATVSLFRLDSDGKLHPLAIVIDYKESVESSVVIFNKRLHPSDSTDSEASDWPWRYAKTCAQVSDFLRHEVEVHLVNTHFVEEVVIVATHRSFDPGHVVFRLLSPHWLKTLSLNAAARSTLVPNVINKIVGLTEEQLYTFGKNTYSRFDWTGGYIPNDLQKRGFPIEEISTSKKFHNYAYGRNMILMWRVLQTFVSSVLATEYTTDEQVANDTSIAAWCAEMRSPTGGALSSFPIITTIDSLVDAIVMCIHIASPQHTAVNYLQQYYQSFVINKPPALCAPQPTSLQSLLTFKEPQLVQALPVDRVREWLLASHLPYLLSSRVAAEQNLVNYALSIASLAIGDNNAPVIHAAAQFYAQLIELITLFKKNSEAMDDQTVPYDVMDPEATAISILI
ncbi:lipoxygenase [Collybia nuda]|uniref:Manganese lipoxygenase n=1 Tax=Collybia nuda TaxID=64659 RepID=A0A9P6CGS5_9AGAR|nr:lipoxygenase [Collybia nuda]